MKIKYIYPDRLGSYYKQKKKILKQSINNITHYVQKVRHNDVFVIV